MGLKEETISRRRLEGSQAIYRKERQVGILPSTSPQPVLLRSSDEKGHNVWIVQVVGRGDFLQFKPSQSRDGLAPS